GSWGLALSLGGLLGQVLIGLSGPVVVLPMAALAALIGSHGLAFAALRLRGRLWRRAAVLSGGAGEGRTYALTASALAVVGVLAGLRLPLEPGTAGSVLLPAVLVLMPLMV